MVMQILIRSGVFYRKKADSIALCDFKTIFMVCLHTRLFHHQLFLAFQNYARYSTGVILIATLSIKRSNSGSDGSAKAGVRWFSTVSFSYQSR